MNIFLIEGNKEGCYLYYYENRSQKEIKKKAFNHSATHILKAICLSFETDFEGSRSAIKKNHHFIQKTPILVLRNHSLFFPTCSYESDECSWVNYYCVRDYYANNPYQMHVQFKVIYSLSGRIMQRVNATNHRVQEEEDSIKLTVKCSQRVFKKQMQRCKEIDQFIKNVYVV